MKDVSFSWNEMLFAMQKTDFHVRAFLRAKNIMLLELRTLMLCLVQLSKWRECKATDAEKLLSQWEKVAKCNFKSKLKYMKDVSFSWNEMLFAMQKTDFHVRAFFKSKNTNASLELRTLMLCLVQLSKWRECKATDAEKLLTQWEKVAKCNFKSKAQVHERCFFLMKWNVICNAEDRFHVLEIFCRASHVRASMHRINNLELLRTLMLCLVQLSKWRECKAKDAEKLLSQWEKVAKCNFKSKLKYMKMFLSHEMKCYLQ